MKNTDAPDKIESVIGVFLEFSKAFYIVNYTIF